MGEGPKVMTKKISQIVYACGKQDIRINIRKQADLR